MKRLVVIVFSLIFIQPLFAQWQMMNSPLATPEIKLVASHPDGYIYAITNQNEVFRKDTSGNQWNKISVLDSTAYCIAISPDGIIYIGTKGGYFYSLDYGHNWIAKTILAPNNYDHYVSDIEFGINDYIYLTSYAYGASGVWVSSDSGNNWTKYNSGLDGSSLTSIVIDSDQNLYTMTLFGEVFKSSNQGMNWQLKSDLQGNCYNMVIDSQNNLFVATNVGLYKSTDLGESFIKIYNAAIVKIFVDDDDNLYGLNVYTYTDSENSINNTLNWDGIIFSSDGGNSWVNKGLVGYYLYDLISINNTIYTGTKKGLQVSTDFGNNWSLSFKYDDQFVKVNDVIIVDDKVFVSSNQGVFISSNHWVNWFQTSLTENTRMVRNDLLGNLYAASDSFYKSTNFGEYWFKTNNSYYPIIKVLITDSNQIFIASGNGSEEGIKVQRSMDQGNTWEYIMFTLGVYDVNNRVFELTQSPNRTIYLSYRDWGVYHPGNIWIDIRYLLKYTQPYDWTTINQEKIIQNICFNDSTMYLATQDEGIFKSYDEGYTLIPINTGLTSNDIRQIIKTPEDVLICLASNGVFRSLDNGNHWANLGLNGFLSTAINSIYYNNGILYACTNNGIGVFIGELPVELTSFTASISQNKVHLNWETATELNNNGFEVQRKLENADWITFGFVQGNGTTTEPRSYTYLDDVSDFISNKIYYRLKQIDYNGNYEFSDEVEVITLPLEYSLSQNYPNPFNPTTKIKYEVPENTNVTLEVFDVLGRLIKTLVNENKSAGRYEVEFNASELSSGLYLYKIKAGDPSTGSGQAFEKTRKMLLLK